MKTFDSFAEQKKASDSLKKTVEETKNSIEKAKQKGLTAITEKKDSETKESENK